MSDPKIIKDAASARPAVKEEGWWETIKVIVQALVIALVVRTLLFQPFDIPSGSLIPTLLVGDYLFVSKYAYGYSHYSLPGFLDLVPQAMPGRIFFSPPKRGDIVVFRPPGDPSEDFIKRVIGLPGDSVQMLGGQLYLNGKAVPKERAAPFVETDPFGLTHEIPRYKETLPNGVSYETLDCVDNGFYDNTNVYTVPPGDFFMMGDNRDNSTDSRVLSAVGYVPFENIVGRAQMIFFSIAEGENVWFFWRWPYSIRWNRIFKIVR